jgi:SAM-dependent methyltransferase
MKYALLQWLACPTCGGARLRLAVKKMASSPAWNGQIPADTPGWRADTRSLDEILEGELTCGDCGVIYPIVDGIPRMVVSDDRAVRSAHTRSRFDASAPEWEAAFLDFAEPLLPSDFVGRLCLDVGCGFGRGSYFAARYGAEVVAVDLDPEILTLCRDNCRDNAHVHCVQADAAHLPFRPSIFDVAYAFGLLHHLDSPWSVFHEVTTRVKSGGRLSIWVYGPRQGASAALSAMIRGVTRDMPGDDLLEVSRLLASALRVGSHGPYRVFHRVPGLSSVVSHLPLHDHHRWPYDVVVADIYDRLRIPVTHTFTREQIEAHYVDEGYLDVVTSRRVRNNESFRATGIRR